MISEESGQSSAEMILLIGVILIIIIIAGNYIYGLSEIINDNLKNLLESGRNSILRKI